MPRNIALRRGEHNTPRNGKESQMKKIGTLMVLAALGALAWPVSTWAKTVNVEMTAIETEVVIDGQGHTYKAWTYNGQFPVL